MKQQDGIGFNEQRKLRLLVRQKSLKASVLAFGLFSLLAGSYLWSRDIHQWSIPHVEKTIEALRRFERCRMPSTRDRYIPLTSPDGKVCAIVVCSMFESTISCSVILNPRRFEGANFDYGPIPELKDLSNADAEILWGPSVALPDENGVRQYRLRNKRLGDYDLLIDFKDDRISRYIVKGPFVYSKEWTSVRKFTPRLKI